MSAQGKGGRVYVEDFCGGDGVGRVNFWAVWEAGRVTFGGDWGEVPPMPAAEVPAVEAVHRWVTGHSGGAE